jgi:hypothetical protein
MIAVIVTGMNNTKFITFARKFPFAKSQSRFIGLQKKNTRYRIQYIAPNSPAMISNSGILQRKPTTYVTMHRSNMHWSEYFMILFLSVLNIFETNFILNL